MNKPINKNKIFAIGDIHGCENELKLLMRTLPLTKHSTIVFLGDYIDRGENSKGVIEFIINLKKKHHIIALMGNHEAMFLDFFKNKESEEAARFIYNGGGATLASYHNKKKNTYEVPDHHMDFISTLPLTHQDDKYYFVHAGLPEKKLSQINEKKDKLTLLWIRDPFINSVFDWGKIIVHGHTPVDRVTITPKRINLDTGCVYNGFLSAIELPENIIYSVPRQSQWTQTFLMDPAFPRMAQRFQGRISIWIDIDNKKIPFETLNYNEFGFLMMNTIDKDRVYFKSNEVFLGEIKTEGQDTLLIEAIIMRIEMKDHNIFYGVKIRKIMNKVVNL